MQRRDPQSKRASAACEGGAGGRKRKRVEGGGNSNKPKKRHSARANLLSKKSTLRLGREKLQKEVRGGATSQPAAHQAGFRGSRAERIRRAPPISRSVKKEK